MSNQNLIIPYTRYDSASELTSEEKALFDRAKAACQTAYAPYSNFRVGAAVMLENGEILSANNQESEVLPCGMCAERSLLYYVQANHPHTRIKALALTSIPGTRICTPCGACRQVIADTEKRQKSPIKILMSNGHNSIIVEQAQALLPFIFELK